MLFRSARVRVRLAAAAAAIAVAAAAAASGAAAEVLRWNAGGGAAGGGYAADLPPGVTVSGGWAYKSGLPIARTRLDAMYGSHRAGTFLYTVAAKPGTYALRIHLAEVWAPNYKVGARVFNLRAGDGARTTGRALKVDVYKRAGAGAKAVVVAFNKVVVGGSGKIIIQCQSVTEQCMISGVSVSPRSAGAGFPTTAPPVDNNRGEDHRAHAVPGRPYTAIDFNGDGVEAVTLDGSGSHSHFFNAATGAAGRIVRYVWTHGSSGAVLGSGVTLTAPFPVGVTPVQLTVTDNTGAVATDGTTVTVGTGATGGWWCYWMSQTSRLPPRWVTAAPRPQYAAATAAVRFGAGTHGWAGFPSPFGAGWAMRCVGALEVATAGRYPFQLTANGPVAVYLGTQPLLALGGAGGATGTWTKTARLAAGSTVVTVVFWKKFDNLGTVQLTTPPELPVSYAADKQLPVLTGLSTSSGGVGGGTTVKLSGSGLFNGETVFFGKTQATIINDGGGESSDSIYVKSPAGTSTVSVTVKTGNGVSNPLKFTYGGTGTGTGGGGGTDVPATTEVKYVSTHLKAKSGAKFTSVPLATSIALGADGLTYFVGSLKGSVYKVRMINHHAMTVGSYCQGPASGDKRIITGVAVNPALTGGSFVYASSSIINYKSEGLSVADGGWANGRIELYQAVADARCLVKVKNVITGLPVSAHDHTVNGLAFDQVGNLLIQAGSSTNAGYNGPGSEKSGGVDESPLSAATLIAYLSKGPAFDGKVTYDQMADPATAKQTGGDVAVFASGLRNAFGLLRHSSGHLYAIDNGGNNGTFGWCQFQRAGLVGAPCIGGSRHCGLRVPRGHGADLCFFCSLACLLCGSGLLGSFQAMVTFGPAAGRRTTSPSRRRATPGIPSFS